MRKSKINKMRRQLRQRVKKRIRITLEKVFRGEPEFVPVAMRYIQGFPLCRWYEINGKIITQAQIIRQNLNLSNNQ